MIVLKKANSLLLISFLLYRIYCTIKRLFKGIDMTKHKDSAYQLILEKALEVVVELGAASLTYEAVSQKSGISRGGILYHFPSKEAMLEALLEHYVGLEMSVFLKNWEKLGNTPETMTQAEVLSMRQKDGKNRDIAIALLASLVHHPALLEKIRPLVERRYQTIMNNPNFAMEAIVLLALDGMYTMHALGLEPLSAKKRKEIFDCMLTLCEKNK